MPTFFSLLSLPWSTSPLLSHSLLQTQQLQSPLPKTFTMKCLEVLALFPPKWYTNERKQFYYRCVFGENCTPLLADQDIRAHAICNLPTFLARLGHMHVQEFITRLKYASFVNNNNNNNKTISGLVMKEMSPIVLEAIARFGGFLLCLADAGNLIWKEQENPTEKTFSKLFFRCDTHCVEPLGFEVIEKTSLPHTTLWFPVSDFFICIDTVLLYSFTVKKCQLCDQFRSPQNNNNASATAHMTASFLQYEGLLSLLSPTRDTTIRVACAQGSFLHILRHAAPYSPSDLDLFWTLYFPMATDTERDIRIAMARVVATFAASDSRVSFVFCCCKTILTAS